MRTIINDGATDSAITTRAHRACAATSASPREIRRLVSWFLAREGFVCQYPWDILLLTASQLPRGRPGQHSSVACGGGSKSLGDSTLSKEVRAVSVSCPAIPMALRDTSLRSLGLWLACDREEESGKPHLSGVWAQKSSAKGTCLPGNLPCFAYEESKTASWAFMQSKNRK